MKLIRPRTPGLPSNATSRPIEGATELEILIRAKLMEEAAEAAAATSREELISELGDLYETLSVLSLLNKINMDQVKEAMMNKIVTKGAIINGVLLTYDPKTTGEYADEDGNPKYSK